MMRIKPRFHLYVGSPAFIMDSLRGKLLGGTWARGKVELAPVELSILMDLTWKQKKSKYKETH